MKWKCAYWGAAAALAIAGVTACGGDSAVGTISNTEDRSIDLTSLNGDGKHIERLSNSGETLKVWCPGHTIIGTLINGWGDTAFMQYMEEKTGVKIEFETPVLGQEKTKFSLMVSSKEYPDMIIEGGNVYTGGAGQMVKDEIVIDINQYLDLTPNFVRELNKSDLRKKEVYSNDGVIAGFPRFSSDDKGRDCWVGVAVRQDLLDQVGMEVPRTYDEWHEVLTAFKEKLGITKPFCMDYRGMPQYSTFVGGFGFALNCQGNTPFYQVDGEIHYAPLEEGYRKYLETMSQWYREGLIDPDFTSLTSLNAEMSTFIKPETGACITAGTLLDYLNKMGAASVEGFQYVPAPHPVKQIGDELHAYQKNENVILNRISVCQQSDKKELALRWIDQLYTEEAILFNNWGIEGKTFEYVSDSPQWTEEVTNNQNGYDQTSMMNYYTTGNIMAGVEEYRRQSSPLNTVGAQAELIWNSYGDNDYLLSAAVTLNEEEQEIYSHIMTEVITYVEEMQVRYIMGEESFDHYDEFVAQIKAMKVEEAMAAYQSAFDRYNGLN